MSSINNITTDEMSCYTTLPDKLWWHSKSSSFKLEFNWSIDNFSFYLEDDPKELTPIHSPEYSAPGYDDLRFYLDLYPNNEKKEDKDYLSLFLFCNSSGFPSPIYAKYKMSLVDFKGDDKHSRACQYKFTKNAGFGFSKMILRSVLLDPNNGLLPNDQLVIRFEANICVILKDQSSISNRIAEENTKQFSLDIASLLEDTKHSDVILAVGGIEFCAHKIILSVRSPVFDAMFNHHTKEACEGKVKIDDVPADVFQDLLQFIYTGTVPEKERLTTELLAASDKYQVEGLKSACEIYLSTSIESVASTLLFADMHNAASLKTKCLKYITDNIFAVMSTEAWFNIVKVRPELMLDISNFNKIVAQEEESK